MYLSHIIYLSGEKSSGVCERGGAMEIQVLHTDLPDGICKPFCFHHSEQHVFPYNRLDR